MKRLSSIILFFSSIILVGLGGCLYTEMGDPGPQGPKGNQGPPGNPGPKGPRGDPATVDSLSIYYSDWLSIDFVKQGSAWIGSIDEPKLTEGVIYRTKVFAYFNNGNSIYSLPWSQNKAGERYINLVVKPGRIEFHASNDYSGSNITFKYLILPFDGAIFRKKGHDQRVNFRNYNEVCKLYNISQ